MTKSRRNIIFVYNSAFVCLFAFFFFFFFFFFLLACLNLLFLILNNDNDDDENRPKPNRFVCPFGLKIGRVCRLILKQYLEAEEMQYHSCRILYLSI